MYDSDSYFACNLDHTDLIATLAKANIEIYQTVDTCVGSGWIAPTKACQDDLKTVMFSVQSVQKDLKEAIDYFFSRPK